MKTNAEILKLLKDARKVSAFAKFLSMSRRGLYNRLDDQSMKANLWGAYLTFVKE